MTTNNRYWDAYQAGFDLGTALLEGSNICLRNEFDHWYARYFPEGCTPEDAAKLREFNHALGEDNRRLRDLLEDAYKRFKQYGMDVDDHAPYHHQKFMDEMKSALLEEKENEH
ncbi:hypothetical protein GCM10023116_46410 [Kistimonas scapharcae]|uniref:Uncharacterized protein n=1 Tax=Kistimonas scapharcae TaxID=1036133 RepID=A0ABP8V9C8_9GAMM